MYNNHVFQTLHSKISASLYIKSTTTTDIIHKKGENKTQRILTVAFCSDLLAVLAP